MLEQYRAELKSRFINGLLKRPFFYELAGDIGKLVYLRKGRFSQGIWLDMVAKQMKAGLKRDNLVVWGNAFFPFELLHGLGVTPCHPETISAIAASWGFSQNAITCAEANGYSSDTCSFYRCGAGLDFQGLLPRPDLVVSTSYLCEGAVKYFNNVSRYYGCDHYLLDVPYHDTKKARKYLADQFRELAEIIAEKQGKPVDMDKLALAMKRSNEARVYMLKINELRHAVPSPLPGDHAIGYVLDMQFFGLGSETGVKFFKALYEECKARVDNGRGPVNNEKHRLLWLHYIRPYHPNDIFSYLGEKGVSVCFGESGHVYWEPMDPDKPFESLAASILTIPSGGPLERRANLAVELAEKYNVDGVIHFSHWGCRQSCGGEYVIRDMMRKKEIPMLILDGDGTDSRNYSREQTRLRLEAFIEMLEVKR